MIFDWRWKKDITNTKYHNVLLDASDRPNKKSLTNARRIKKAVKSFWTETLKETYPAAKDKFNDIKPDVWFKEYVERLGMATKPAPVFRHIMGKANIAYVSANDLATKEYAQKNATLTTYRSRAVAVTVSFQYSAKPSL